MSGDVDLALVLLNRAAGVLDLPDARIRLVIVGRHPTHESETPFAHLPPPNAAPTSIPFTTTVETRSPGKRNSILSGLIIE